MSPILRSCCLMLFLITSLVSVRMTQLSFSGGTVVGARGHLEMGQSKVAPCFSVAKYADHCHSPGAALFGFVVQQFKPRILPFLPRHSLLRLAAYICWRFERAAEKSLMYPCDVSANYSLGFRLCSLCSIFTSISFYWSHCKLFPSFPWSHSQSSF